MKTAFIIIAAIALYVLSIFLVYAALCRLYREDPETEGLRVMAFVWPVVIFLAVVMAAIYPIEAVMDWIDWRVWKGRN